MAEEVGSLQVNIGLNSQGFQQGISSINKQLKVAEAEFKNASSALSGFGSETDKLKAKSEYLSKAVDLQSQKVDQLKEAYEKARATKGENAKATQNLAIQYNNAQARLNSLRGQLDQTNTSIANQENKWNQLSNTLAEAGERIKAVGESVSNAGKTLTANVTAPLAAVGAAGAKLAMDFEESLNKVGTIADETVLPIEEIGDTVLELSDDVGVAASELNETLYQTISATGDTGNSLGYVEVASKAAIGGFSDTTTAVDGLTTVMNSYGLKGTEAMQSVSDQMLTAQNYGKTTFGEMASSIGSVIPIASSMNVSTKELFASIATLTKNGIGTSESITGVKAALSNVIKPSKQACDMAASLGLEFNAAHLKSVGWAKFLDEVKEKTGGNSEEMAQLFGSVEALNAVTVLATTGSEDFAGALDAMENSAGATAKAFEKMDQGAKDSIEDTLNSIQNLGIELGQILLPMINDVVAKVGEWVQWFKGLDDSTKETIVKVGMLAAAVGPVLLVIGKLITIGGTLVTAFSTVTTAIGVATGTVTGATGAAAALGTAFTVMTGPVGIAIAAIAGVTVAGVALWKNWDTVKEKSNELWTSLVATFEGIKTSISNVWTSIETATENTWKSMVDFVSGLWEGFKNTISNITQKLADAVVESFKWLYNHNYYFQDLVDFVVGAWESLKVTTSNIWTSIKGFLNGLWNGIKTTCIGVWTGIKQGVEGILNGLETSIMNIWNAIKGGVGIVLNGIKTIVSNGWNSIKTGAEIAWNSIKTAIVNVWTKLKELAGTWAKNMMDMFVGGIKNKINDVKEAVRSVAEKIKDFLGFHSPTKDGPASESDQWAPNFMNMFASGIAANTNLVQTAAEGVASVVKSTFDSAVSYAQDMAKKIENISSSSGGSFKTSDTWVDGNGNYLGTDGNIHNDGSSGSKSKKDHKDKSGNIGGGETKEEKDARRERDKARGMPDGYASGTDSATRGWHVVGEEGPELLWFGGGETVLNNSNTKALLQSANMSIRALGKMQNVSASGIDYEKLADALARKIGRSITQNITIKSPAPLSPSEVARQNKRALEKMALEW
ncbi:phage tail tape measure protein, TP901 family, core region [Peptoclostridium litorale DSM 5388]|uniref:TP901 family phage tail tape measure protein n=1 Tax=Peptoclostridium litorale DSM 5388 TaxID=1121324 RepID=A0A069RFS6_PEPLI|nr:phage tail tape measure protein [Peptoclostridium litorale]KDR95899.1 TP901 family phage tail tape measure protein [Peptoclostridium litorale DSM 5388]SIO10402.1 phage tail tape measure protein, TP901 family, core region [Peptoclostridium litorale DSM 5388]